MSTEYIEYLNSLIRMGGHMATYAQAELRKYSDDQPREDNGRFADGSGSGNEAPKDRQEAIAYHFSKAEQYAIANLHGMLPDSGVSGEERAHLRELASVHREASAAAREFGIDSPEYAKAADKVKQTEGSKSVRALVQKFAADQGRDDHGRFASGGGSIDPAERAKFHSDKESEHYAMAGSSMSSNDTEAHTQAAEAHGRAADEYGKAANMAPGDARDRQMGVAAREADNAEMLSRSL